MKFYSTVVLPTATILATFLPTSTTAQQPLPCLETTTEAPFDAGFGDCSTYAQGLTNNDFCTTDVDSNSGVMAQDACAECGVCVMEAPEPFCIETDTQFGAGFGDCSTYAQGLTNNGFCSTDVDSNGIVAQDACAECGVCVEAEQPPMSGGPALNALYIMSNAASGNEVIAFARDASNGGITFVDSYPTGTAGTPGVGGVTAEQNAGDPLGSQNALQVSSNGRCIFAVNAGSDNLSIFRISEQDATFLELTGIYPSSGNFPVSIAQFEDLVYVLNAGSEGSISGFSLDDENCLLTPIAGSTRSFGLINNSNPPSFIASPGQIGFTPNGEHILVTIKIDNNGAGLFIVYQVNGDGTPSATPTNTPSNGSTEPFSFAFDEAGHIFVTEVNNRSLSSYEISAEGVLIPIANSVSVSITQDFPCWNRYFGGFVITSNNSISMSVLSVDDDGALSLVDGSAASTAEGISAPIDLEISPDGQFVYVISTFAGGQPNIVVFQNDGESLAMLGSVSGGIPNAFDTVNGIAGMAIL